MKVDSNHPHHAADARTTDIVEQQIARVYAQALFAAAVAMGHESEVVDEMNSLVDDVLVEHPNFDAILGSALIGADEKAAAIDRVFGDHASNTMLSFLKVVAQHERLDCLKAIRHEIIDLHNQHCNKIPVELIFATKTDDRIVDEIVGKLRDQLGAEPIVSMRFDPALLAGFVVRVGDRVLDASTRTQFRRTRDTMNQRSIDLIQTRRSQLVDES